MPAIRQRMARKGRHDKPAKALVLGIELGYDAS